MEDFRLCDSDLAVMSVIWEKQPLSSRQLVEECGKKLGWKKSTTYTVLKKLCDRGFAQNQDATVTALISQEKVQAFESQRVVDRAFSGSLPRFLVSFLDGRHISPEEAQELMTLIEQYKEV